MQEDLPLQVHLSLSLVRLDGRRVNRLMATKLSSRPSQNEESNKTTQMTKPTAILLEAAFLVGG